ncbi:copper chaperone PCu(A)C [Pseudomonas syringae pv. pisi str. PP1]|uniref:copper chaperone PCu(A)C n=1 Tax=Pseudomonas syringae TaxID=317 RepID=UPI00040CCE6B|nr:copper chaperone PCu(A)C [Pseudomonas syringae]AZG88372.1 copper chaperone PCu(A)C [Pseudomonas syringae pv. pisi str. PP1]RMM25063.1 Copper-binding protein [Pseudomonas syringae pv. pisi]UZS61936.1 copper chaperone PCu(A)C [Pseudomonas syringae]
MLKKALLLAVLLLPACVVHAHEYKAGSLLIGHPWSMELPPNAPTVAAYFTLENKGDSVDRLISVDTPIAGQAQLHEHVHADGLMKMQHVQAVDIPAGAKVAFAPMAWHVMLLDIKDRSKLVVGQRFPMTLHFEKAGDVEVQVVVQKKASEHQH